jgi:hypothetical protein
LGLYLNIESLESLEGLKMIGALGALFGDKKAKQGIKHLIYGAWGMDDKQRLKMSLSLDAALAVEK